MRQSLYGQGLLLFIVLCSTIRATEDADKVFAAKDYALARDLYIRDREISYQKQQNQNWKQATIQIIRCHTALGDTERAVQEYFLLCSTDAAPPLEFLPLPWFVHLHRTAGIRPHEQAAERYVNDGVHLNPAGKLLAAAVLSVCTDSAKRLRGTAILRELTTVENQEKEETQKQVALLASAFLWKQRIPGLRQLTDLKPLQKLLESIPLQQRAGVYFLLAEGAAQINEDETAVLYWMRLPILYPENKVLVTESLRQSAEILGKLGRKEQENKLRDEMK